MVLQDGVHFEEAVLVAVLVVVAVLAFTVLYKDERSKKEIIRAKKEAEGKAS